MPGNLCRRVGPGRLPYAGRRDVGGAVSMGGMALLVTLVWYGLVGVARLVVPGESTDLGFLAALGVFSPAAVVGAVAFGWLLWRYYVPDDPDPLRGAVAGGVTVLLALLAVGVVAGLVFAASNLNALTADQALVAAVDFTMFGTLAAGVGGVLTGWLALPLGAFGGWYHERARRDADPTGSGADAVPAP